MSSVGNFDLRYNLSDISDDDESKVNDNTTEKRYLPPVEEVSSLSCFYVIFCIINDRYLLVWSVYMSINEYNNN